MIDHIGISVSDISRSKRFYEQVLKSINYSIIMDLPAEVTGNVAAVGLGENNKPDFWISESKGDILSNHIAFTVKNRKLVDDFYEAGTQAGGRDNGKPGIREMYHPNYYGAFILDLDGHNIEAVCHLPEKN